MSNVGDQLLLLVSARRRLTWDTFRQSFDLLHARALSSRSGVDEPVAYVRQKSLRLLNELAHCELPPFGSSAAVCIAPTVLARLPLAGLPTAVLCGSRGSDAGTVLRTACSGFGQNARVLRIGQRAAGGYAPTALAIEATDEELLKRVASAAGVRYAPYPPGWALLTASASLAEYEASLAWTSDPDPIWPRKDFDLASRTFRAEQRSGPVRLSSFQDPVTRRQIHRLWRGSVAATVDRSWGRWLYLHLTNMQALLFDSQRQAVAVPATVPLPGLLGRALALFSGVAPTQESRPDRPDLLLDHYMGVPSEGAEVVATKLGQPFEAPEAA
jgi:hypothetical protein